ncbi:C40 family peptidase [Fructobacillus parabroussonetiae]|uniref:LysM peptidoglycan-binding domain-containing protein n=1 Tax=Fructobacillus parabroussonetiae TaxID=2713174 RepID=A0ABS5QYY6_9LACO|nr:LysM peptidoglycan-binding domain-containing protein [Fructobacillus parabroussonetiae]MBS9337122.1 LysM peptidoglycan-binding domain-containing protein [Fructobacillus parabroussonetiae]
MENNKMKQLSKRLMVTAGATTLAATGAVLGANVIGNAQTVSANDVSGQATQSDQQNHWSANSTDHVRAAVKSQGAKNLSDYQVQWGDTLSAIAAAFGTSTDDAANQLGLTDHGLLVAGQKMAQQAPIIQGLKDAGYLQDGQQTTQADLGNGDQNLIVLQQGTPTLDNGQNDQSTEQSATVNNQAGSQSGSEAAYQQASQAAADSQAASQASSQAASQAASKQQAQSQSQVNQGQSQTAQSSTAASTNDAATATNAGQSGTDNEEGLSTRMGDDDQSANDSVDTQGSVTPTAYVPAASNNANTNSQSTDAAATQTNRVDSNAVINWFYNHMGQLTYDMAGSRNGADGTADCSGSMVEAMYEAGASKPAYLYNTDSMHSYLQANGYHLISTNTPWNAERGDIVIWGQQGASGGSAGHVQIMTDANNAISVNYAHGDQAGAAVSVWNYDNAYYYNQKANGGSLAYYVYRQ